MKEKNNILPVVSIRLISEAPCFSNKPILEAQDAIHIIGNMLEDWDRECLVVVNQSSSGKPINMNIVSIGTVNTTIVSGREIFKSAILSNATSIIMLHNHPSGTLIASKMDIDVTKKIIEAGKLLDIYLTDHIILGKNGEYLSLRKENYITDAW